MCSLILPCEWMGVIYNYSSWMGVIYNYSRGECWGSLLLHQIVWLLGYFSFWHVGNCSPFGFGALYLCNFCNFYEVLRTYVLLIPTLFFLKKYVQDLRLVRDKFTHVSRGFAFVHFHSVSMPFFIG